PEAKAEEDVQPQEVKAEVVLFFNMGHDVTQVSVVKYTARNSTLKTSYIRSDKSSNIIPEISVLSHAIVPNFGGRVFENYVLEGLVSDFGAQYGNEYDKKLAADGRAMARVAKQAGKVKEILSANEEIPVSIESLFDE